MSLFICSSILFSRIWISFTVIILNSFSSRLSISSSFDLVGYYNVPSPAGYFSAFPSCLNFCVLGPLSSGLRAVAPLNFRACFLWVQLDQWLVKVSCLGELCLCSGGWNWIFSLECNEVSNGEFWGVHRYSMALGSPSFNAQGCVPVLLEN